MIWDQILEYKHNNHLERNWMNGTIKILYVHTGLTMLQQEVL